MSAKKKRSIHAVFEPDCGAAWEIYRLLYEARSWHTLKLSEMSLLEVLSVNFSSYPTVSHATRQMEFPLTARDVKEIMDAR